MHKRTHAPSRVSAWGREVWMLAEASVECSVVSGATAAGADEAGCTQEREGAGGGNQIVLEVADRSVKSTSAVDSEAEHVDRARIETGTGRVSPDAVRATNVQGDRCRTSSDADIAPLQRPITAVVFNHRGNHNVE